MPSSQYRRAWQFDRECRTAVPKTRNTKPNEDPIGYFRASEPDALNVARTAQKPTYMGFSSIELVGASSSRQPGP